LFKQFSMYLGFLILLMVFSACTSEQKIVCDQRDWYELGRQDGLLGHRDNFSGVERRPACEQSEVISDVNRYNSGHAAGLIAFCTSSNGFELGFSGEPFTDICPQGLADRFQQAFRLGERARELSNDSRQLESQILSTEQEILQRTQQQEIAALQRRLEELQTLRSSKLEQITRLRKSL